MKSILGLVLIFVGIALGLYAGIWWAFIGGIVQVIDGVKAADTDALAIALGIVRIVFAGAIGGFCAIVCWVPGMAMLKD